MGSAYLDHDEGRRRMIAETSAFIEWGLRHPEQVRWIPRQKVGSGRPFTRRMSLVFWYPLFATATEGPLAWLRGLLGR